MSTIEWVALLTFLIGHVAFFAWVALLTFRK